MINLSKPVSIVFFLSAILKLISFQSTVLLFESQFGLNYLLIASILALLMCIELICVYALWLHQIKGVIIGIVMLSFFLVLAVYQLWSGQDNCGCFGTIIQQTPAETLLKNLLLIIVLFFLLRKFKGRLNDI